MKLSRRRFLKSTGLLGVSSMASFSSQSIAASLLSSDKNKITGHKALVCVFLYGGNDSYNMLVPSVETSAYTDYLARRPHLGLKENEILPTGLNSENNINIGIHHEMKSLLPLFEKGHATVLINSGQLLSPTSKSLIDHSLVKLPDLLMAHNSQQEMWQSGATNLNSKYGWVGKMFDIISVKSDLSPLISISNEKKLLRSKHLQQTIVSSKGAGNYSALNDEVRLNGLFFNFSERQYDNLYMRNYAHKMIDSLDENERMKKILIKYPSNSQYSNTKLSKQLNMVSRLIKAQGDLGQSRQVFFVGMNGFDTHKNQQKTHGSLLAELADGLVEFNHDMESSGLNEQVVSITMSDFGRRIQANASGTDHGWGGHQIVVGGDLHGNKAYGNWPDLKPKSEDDYNNGRVIPGIAADQVHASLCQWLGLSDADILSIFPNLSHFDLFNIPFLQRDHIKV
ncbi:hypothetical protein PCNPT3_08945 [Psychromonas sp. CNPT3]|uniref:DUF1501 domain-containing protein n=1 Tax=Psychromonas sp. CNPT3 TaxID=314282 RepID=UPI00006E957D|nr:DUF1501 domain-containing protein [Psychromonas sp. CNPT3]AGH81727.1 hypothetical protein PCNPT3_08945 [Psychromonas sp. CNPT3]